MAGAVNVGREGKECIDNNKCTLVQGRQGVGGRFADEKTLEIQKLSGEFGEWGRSRVFDAMMKEREQEGFGWAKKTGKRRREGKRREEEESTSDESEESEDERPRRKKRNGRKLEKKGEK